MKGYSLRLRAEAKSDLEISISRFVRSLAHSTAIAIRGFLDPDTAQRSKDLTDFVSIQRQQARENIVENCLAGQGLDPKSANFGLETSRELDRPSLEPPEDANLQYELESSSDGHSDSDTDLAGGLKLDQIIALIKHGPPVNELKSKLRQWLDSKLPHSRETEIEQIAKPKEILPLENNHGIAARDLRERKALETGEQPIKIDSSTMKESANECTDEKSKELPSKILACKIQQTRMHRVLFY